MPRKRVVLAVIGLVLLGLFLFGFALPFLFSAKSTELVLIGIGVVALLVYGSVVFTINKLKQIGAEDEESDF